MKLNDKNEEGFVLKPGESKTIPIELTQEAIAWLNSGKAIQMQVVIAPPKWLSATWFRYFMTLTSAYGIGCLLGNILKYLK